MSIGSMGPGPGPIFSIKLDLKTVLRLWKEKDFGESSHLVAGNICMRMLERYRYELMSDRDFSSHRNRHDFFQKDPSEGAGAKFEKAISLTHLALSMDTDRHEFADMMNKIVWAWKDNKEPPQLVRRFIEEFLKNLEEVSND